jgi:uncharacterized CHY-type Zn-finger protein
MTEVHGRLVDGQTRCAHYYSDLDIVAIQFKCCQRYYACYECHEESESHEPTRWVTADLGQHALLCGACQRSLTIAAYLDCDFTCPSCGAPFNPGCAQHYDRYFDVPHPLRPKDSADPPPPRRALIAPIQPARYFLT